MSTRVMKEFTSTQLRTSRTQAGGKQSGRCILRMSRVNGSASIHLRQPLKQLARRPPHSSSSQPSQLTITYANNSANNDIVFDKTTSKEAESTTSISAKVLSDSSCITTKQSSSSSSSSLFVMSFFAFTLLNDVGLDTSFLFSNDNALTSHAAFASGGAYGILEGRSVALLHPLAMFAILSFTLYSGYLGWQWRRVRTIGDDISQKQSILKGLKSKKEQLVEVAVTAAAATAEAIPVASMSAEEVQISKEIEDLKETRKTLSKAGYREQHFNTGSILLAAGVLFSIEGGMNTYMRVGKLFPGPHLFAGLGITLLWALAAALVPLMQKGNETARSAHIALNAVNVLLFLWQVPTGLEIVGKVFQFTKWP